MDINFKSMLRSLFVVAAIVGASNASASLAPFQSFVGKYAMSTDGFGSVNESGVISASVPAGSTIVAAYLYSATNNTDTVPAVTLDGNLVSFGPAVSNATACCNLKSYRADVTSLVAAAINGGLGGIYDFNVNEGNETFSIDGEALVVIYSNPTLPEATVGLLDGFASVTGDTTNINFATPLNPADPGFFAEMSLGISFSCCDSQRSTIKVNDLLLTENAGNHDDGAQLSNGSLITVGGFDDALSSGGDSYANDGERYDLASFVTAGDTTIKVDTFNASQDDNIFFAGFYVSGKAGINEEPPTEVPEPGSMLLLLLGVAALLFGRKRELLS
jgi:hypothetical protein